MLKKIKQKRSKFTQNNSESQLQSRIYPQLQSRIYPELPTVVILIIFGLLIGLVSSCDNDLYISSNGKICEKNKCKTLDMLSFPIQTGQSICFRDVDGDVLSMTITATEIFRMLSVT